MSLTKVNYIDKETVITAQNLNDIQDAIITLENKEEKVLAPVAESGNYEDLTNKPTIPSIEGLATETYVTNAINTAIDNAIGGSY